jgi:hypothetical protein
MSRTLPEHAKDRRFKWLATPEGGKLPGEGGMAMPSDLPHRGQASRLVGWLLDLFGLPGAIFGLATGLALAYACLGPPPPPEGPTTVREEWAVYLALPGLMGLLVGTCAAGVLGAAVGRKIELRRA